MGKTRSKKQVEEELKALKAKRAAHGSFYPPAYDGAVSALEWVLGECEEIDVGA